MAQKPTFIVGARAKIKVDSTTLAFATDVTYSVDVTHVPIEVLGSYEVVAYEPVGYRVSGTLTVVRFTSNPNTTPADTVAASSKGNSSFSMGGNTTGAVGPQASFNPANLLLSQTFDIEVFDRRDGVAANAGQSFIKIRDARFERRSANLTSKGMMQEQYTFNGILFDDDVASVAKSGPNT